MNIVSFFTYVTYSAIVRDYNYCYLLFTLFFVKERNRFLPMNYCSSNPVFRLDLKGRSQFDYRWNCSKYKSTRTKPIEGRDRVGGWRPLSGPCSEGSFSHSIKKKRDVVQSQKYDWRLYLYSRLRDFFDVLRCSEYVFLLLKPKSIADTKS